jgi:YVTN family beta-propeller protein
VASVCIGNWPQSVIVDPANQLVYAASEYSQNVSVLTLNGLQKLTTISTGTSARGVAIDPNTGTMFVTDGLGDNVSVISTSSNTLVGEFSLGGYIYLVGDQYDPYTGLLLFLANVNDDLLFVNATTHEIAQTTTLPANTGGGVDPIAAIDPASHVIYYAARGTYQVQEIDETNGNTLGYLSTNGSYGPTNTFYDAVNGLLYVMLGGWQFSSPGNQVEVFNAATGTEVTTLNVGVSPAGYAFDPQRNLLYVSCPDSDSISVINTVTNQVVGNVSLGANSEPGQVAVDPSTGNLYVGEDGTGMLVELAPGVASNSTTDYWTPVAPSSSPSARAGFGMVYDDALGKVVVFGGCTSGHFFDQYCNATNETWTYSGGNWTQLHPTVFPSARVMPSMVYDSALQQVLLFGGVTSFPAYQPLNDTWEFNGTTWTQLFPTVSPPASGMDQAMAYDTATGAVVLVAGGWLGGPDNENSPTLNETWTFSAGQWTEVLNGTGPSPRGAESFAYDAPSRSVVLFGGNACGKTTGTWLCPNFNDTWTFANGSWTEQNATVSPSLRNMAAFAFDPQLNASLLFAGHYSEAYYDDAWTYANGSWTSLSTPVAPCPRQGMGLVYDATDRTMVLFGGYLNIGGPIGGVEIFFNDTWTFGVARPPPGVSVVSLEISEQPVPVGSPTVIVADVRSAIPVSYAFSGLPPGCGSVDTSVLVCSPTAAGTYRVVVTATDSFGASARGSGSLIVGYAPGQHPPTSLPGVSPLTLVLSAVAGATIGAVAVAAVALARGRERRREREEGVTIARELQNPREPDRPTP